MRFIDRIELPAVAVTLLLAATPALAGTPITPAPVAGAGIGALVAVAAGYRYLRSRLRK
ncbi:hypothetical protein OF829_06315 [Sphingomonas sp. LB-2]|uniref:hypothetical protein n=1 Tax=Sphingomonas caeni TaxID=2984949 RepID=UPI00222FD8F2|nr:hypothetical protein [Sphingomonas caeni]MCW3846847.1 hypothetical protein [Sphingomonas caeni]